ncbi:MAG: hypothetical protein ACMG6E_02585 [Candidatus Roizmanbacteria bacterium]
MYYDIYRKYKSIFFSKNTNTKQVDIYISTTSMARKCLNLAESKLEYQIAEHGLPTDCTICKGTRMIQITMQNIGGKKDGKVSTNSMPCYHCRGGITKEKIREQLLQKLIYCKCAASENSTHAHDGHKVFGNDTYLCDDCGMVTQFG